MTDEPVSVVTGANSGIGRATAIHLAAQGHDVYGTVRATSRKADKVQAMVDEAGVEVHLVELDVADDDSVRDGFAQILDDGGPWSTISSTTRGSVATPSPRSARRRCTSTS